MPGITYCRVTITDIRLLLAGSCFGFWNVYVWIQSHSNHKHSAGFHVLMWVEHSRIPTDELVRVSGSLRLRPGCRIERWANRTIMKSCHSVRNDKTKTWSRLNLTIFCGVVDTAKRPTSRWNTLISLYMEKMEEATDARPPLSHHPLLKTKINIVWNHNRHLGINMFQQK